MDNLKYYTFRRNENGVDELKELGRSWYPTKYGYYNYQTLVVEANAENPTDALEQMKLGLLKNIANLQEHIKSIDNYKETSNG